MYHKFSLKLKRHLVNKEKYKTECTKIAKNPKKSYIETGKRTQFLLELLIAMKIICQYSKPNDI